MNTILVIDIGNSRVCAAVARGERVGRPRYLDTGNRDPRAWEGLLRAAMGRGGAGGAIVASVVPAATRMCAAAVTRTVGSKPLIADHRLALGVTLDYPQPATIGADRLANAAGAFARYGAPAIAADFGTAATFDVVAEGGVYRGGVIAPGLPLMTRYLSEKTALLPSIDARGAFRPVGRSTAAAMRAGARLGYRGLVREILTALLAEPGLEGARVCATGGDARAAIEGLDMDIERIPALTLYGLARIYTLNAA